MAKFVGEVFSVKIKKATNRIFTRFVAYDSNENRTRDSTLRGSRLNRLTMRPFFIVIEISLFMITYFFVFCKCLYARCGKILKICLSGKDLNIFFKKTFTEILHILFFTIYLRRNHCSGGEYQKESGLFLSA